MATAIWEPKALATSQVDTVTVAGVWAAGDTVTLTINTKDLIITIGTLVTTAEVATTIKEAWNSETFTDTTAEVTPTDGGTAIAEHSEITATLLGSVVSLTGPAGEPFTLSVTEVTAGTGTATEATATSPTGPNHYDNANNWSTGAVPIANDDVVIGNTDVSILWGLGQSGVALTSFSVRQDFTGTIGLANVAPGGYQEYREPDAGNEQGGYLQIDGTIITIGEGDGTGSGRIKLDSGATANDVRVVNTGTRIENSLPALQWKGLHASANTMEVIQGDVGVAVSNADAAILSTLEVSNGSFRTGNNVTITTATFTAANVSLGQVPTGTTTQHSGTTVVASTSTATSTLYRLFGGTLVYNGDAGAADFTTISLGGSEVAALLDLSNNPNGVLTVGTWNAFHNSQVNDPRQVLIAGDVPTIQTGVRSVTFR